jgi:hypothetical protein
MEDQLKAIEIELAYLRKAIEELKTMRVIEMHYHFTNTFEGYPEDYIEEQGLS